MNTDRRGFMRFLSAGTAAAGITTQMLHAEALGKSAVTHEFLKQQHADDARFNYEADRFDLVSWALKKLLQMSKPFSFYTFLDGVQARAVQ